MSPDVSPESLDSAGESESRERVTPSGASIDLLLQQHQSWLLRSVVSQGTYRVVNTVVIALILLGMGSTDRITSTIASLMLASLVAALWHSEKQVIAERLGLVEKALGRKSAVAFDDLYVNYRFEVSIATTRHSLLQLEPLLWLMIILVTCAVRFIR